MPGGSPALIRLVHPAREGDGRGEDRGEAASGGHR